MASAYVAKIRTSVTRGFRHHLCAICAAATLLLCFAITGCQTPQQSSPLPYAAKRSSLPSSANDGSHDLTVDEQAGGHTLSKHVGRTDDELGERLERERSISAASTYNDRQSAEHAVAIALHENRDRIQRWLSRRDGHPNLVLDYKGNPNHPVGRSLHRGQDQPQPCADALVVLRWDGPDQYHVLTSYPECR
jgi:hypothetical protein